METGGLTLACSPAKLRFGPFEQILASGNQIPASGNQVLAQLAAGRLCRPTATRNKLRFGLSEQILASAEQILAQASCEQQLESKIQRACAAACSPALSVANPC
jgi:hypothetical protein